MNLIYKIKDKGAMHHYKRILPLLFNTVNNKMRQTKWRKIEQVLQLWQKAGKTCRLVAQNLQKNERDALNFSV